MCSPAAHPGIEQHAMPELVQALEQQGHVPAALGDVWSGLSACTRKSGILLQMTYPISSAAAASGKRNRSVQDIVRTETCQAVPQAKANVCAVTQCLPKKPTLSPRRAACTHLSWCHKLIIQHNRPVQAYQASSSPQGHLPVVQLALARRHATPLW